MEFQGRICPRGASYYTWQAGDTAQSVAQRNGTTVQALQVLNPDVNFATLPAGTEICLPSQSYTCISGAPYTVQPGDSFTSIAAALGVPESVIALTFVALGTSLTELVTSVTAALKRNCDIAVGNIVGSNLFNIMFVVGITAIITPVVYAPAFKIDSAVAVGAVVLLWLCVLRKQTLNRLHGIIMLLCYGGYFAYLMV